MARLTDAEAGRALEGVQDLLSSWWANKDSDSVRVQRQRASDFLRGQELLEHLVMAVQPEQRLRLTIGKTAARGSTFHKGPYDFLDETPTTIAAESTVVLHLAHPVVNGDLGRVIYVGDYGVEIAPTEVARTLIEGGELVIVPAEEAEK